MIVRKIKYAPRYVKRVKKLHPSLLAIVIAKEKIFRNNPLHPSIRLHELHGRFRGLWSISVTGSYRIIFERQDNGVILSLYANIA